MSLAGQYILHPDAIGAVPLSDKIFCIMGADTPGTLTRPDDRDNYQYLVLMADVGDWRIRLGASTLAFPTQLDPDVTDDADGTGGVKLTAGNSLVLPAGSAFNVGAYNPTDVLSYYWV